MSVAACGRAPTPPSGIAARLVLLGTLAPEVTVLRFETTSGTCGYDAAGPQLAGVDLVETADSVTVTARLEAPRQQPDGAVCSQGEQAVPVTVPLERELGTRTILDGSCRPPARVLVKGESRIACDDAGPTAKPESAGTWSKFDPGPLAPRGQPYWVWTGSELIVLGGLSTERSGAFDDGAAYDAESGRWRRIARRPAPGQMFAPAWTGREVVVLGVASGLAMGFQGVRTGHAYDPAKDTWHPIPDAPEDLRWPDAWWTGGEILFWQAGSGALYDPERDAWRTIPPIGLAGAVGPSRAAWLDSVLAVQAAKAPPDGGPRTDTLYLFDPDTNRWRAAAPLPEPVPSWGVADGVWTGEEEIFFSPGIDNLPGFGQMPGFPTGPPAPGRPVAPQPPGTPHAEPIPEDVRSRGVALAYDPDADRWRRIALPPVKTDGGLGYFTGVPIGDGRLVVRVADSARPLVVYEPGPGTWRAVAAPSDPIPAADGVIAWTGEDVLLWGRSDASGMGASNAAWRWTPPDP